MTDRDACVDDEIRVFRDGDAWCAVRRDGFTNIQECHCGFDATPDGAVRALLKDESTVTLPPMHLYSTKGTP